MLVGLIIAGGFIVLLVGFVLFLRRAGGGSFPWFQFYLKGKEQKFSFREINLLRRVAVDNRLNNPTSLFWSVRLLDRSIKSIITRYRSTNEENSVEAISFVNKLYDFRKRVEFDQPRWTMGLKSTREITNRQRVRILLPDNTGPFTAIVVDNLRRYMAVSYPQGPKTPVGFTWKGQQIGVNFWRDGDAGYYFKTRVVDDYFDKKYPILHIAHTDNIVRTQKRRSVRADTNEPAYLFPLRSIEEGGEDWESSSGLRCRLVDVSEDGAALLIGGRAKVGLPVKFQFHLAEERIVMSGVVRGANFNEKRNRSLLHIQARAPGLKMRNAIRSYVYNIFGERPQGVKRPAL
jgi:c-di-GMP-binding flagellar brake protein YcgR